MVAVILAAGKGSRLGNYTKDLPKSLLPLNKNGDTLLDYNLKMLNTFELKKIIIVTGFNSDKVEHHVKKYSKIEIVYNHFWNYCNVLGSLYIALNYIDDDFLFLHADTLADTTIWNNLLTKKGEMVLPFDRKKCGQEEMKVLVKGTKVIEITKEMDPATADGEFLGIAKFLKNTIPFFKETAETLLKKGELNHYMESVIQEAIDKRKFEVTALDILEHKFIEVDFEEDYLKAKNEFGKLNF